MVKREKIKRNLIKAVTVFMGAALLCACNGAKEEDTTEKTTKNDTTTEKKTESTTEKTTTHVTTEDFSEADIDAIYQPIIDEVTDVVKNGFDQEKDYKYISTGLKEKLIYGTNEYIGYIKQDINNDKVPELLIGLNESDGGNGRHSYVLEAYITDGNEPILFLDGWTKNSYRWLGDGKFYYFGTAGAGNTYVGLCYLDEDNYLKWEDYYYVSEDENYNPLFYHNTVGLPTEEDEKLDISSDEFYGMITKYENACKQIKWNDIGIPKMNIDDQSGYGGGGSKEAESDVMDRVTGQWLSQKGVSLYIFDDDSWMLRDDEDNWLCEGTISKEKNGDKVSITLKSEMSELDDNKLGEGLIYCDEAGYLTLQLTFFIEIDNYEPGKMVEFNKAYVG